MGEILILFFRSKYFFPPAWRQITLNEHKTMASTTPLFVSHLRSSVLSWKTIELGRGAFLILNLKESRKRLAVQAFPLQGFEHLPNHLRNTVEDDISQSKLLADSPFCQGFQSFFSNNGTRGLGKLAVQFPQDFLDSSFDWDLYHRQGGEFSPAELLCLSPGASEYIGLPIHFLSCLLGIIVLEPPKNDLGWVDRAYNFFYRTRPFDAVVHHYVSERLLDFETDHWETEDELIRQFTYHLAKVLFPTKTWLPFSDWEAVHGDWADGVVDFQLSLLKREVTLKFPNLYLPGATAPVHENPGFDLKRDWVRKLLERYFILIHENWQMKQQLARLGNPKTLSGKLQTLAGDLQNLALQLTGLSEEIQTVAPAAARKVALSDTEEYVFYREGNYWKIRFDRHMVGTGKKRFEKGMYLIHKLLSSSSPENRLLLKELDPLHDASHPEKQATNPQDEESLKKNLLELTDRLEVEKELKMEFHLCCDIVSKLMSLKQINPKFLPAYQMYRKKCQGYEMELRRKNDNSLYIENDLKAILESGKELRQAYDPKKDFKNQRRTVQLCIKNAIDSMALPAIREYFKATLKIGTYSYFKPRPGDNFDWKLEHDA